MSASHTNVAPSYQPLTSTEAQHQEQKEQKEQVNLLSFAVLHEFETQNKKGNTNKATFIMKVFLGTVGTLAGMFYWGPSESCAKETSCGNWALGNLFGLLSEDGIRWLHLISGGTGFAGTNAYFSYKAIPAL